jgi:thiamine kinase-like enzyme
MALPERVEAIVGQGVVSIDEIPGAGGYTPALRRIATLADGETVFVKAATSELTAKWLEAEQRSYAALGGASFVPRVLGADDGVLVLEDLRDAHWPPPWRSGDLDRVLTTLADVAATPPPEAVPDLESMAGKQLRVWHKIADAPEPFLGLGLCSREWFDRSIGTRVDAETRGTLDGDALVHFDVRSDNLCLLDDRVVLVDWNNAARGRPDYDVVAFAQGVTVEGGPPPDEIAPDADPFLVAMLTSYFARNAPKPLIPDAPRVRDIQRAQLRVCLPWMCRLLGL